MRPLIIAVRSLLRRPVYTALSIVLLTLGVGAVGPIFSLIDAAFLRPLPYPKAERLLWISSLQPGPNGAETAAGLAVAQVRLARSANQSFEAIEAAIARGVTVVVGDEPEPVDGLQSSAGLFALLGAQPVMGRVFQAEDEATGNTLAIVSHSFWQRRLGADPKVIGRSLNVDGIPRTIIGVLPERFAAFLIPADVYTPLALDATQMQNSWRGIMAVGRIRSGVPPERATADLDRINGQVAELMPSYRGTHFRVRPLREVMFGGDRNSLAVTFAAVLLLLVLAIANIANLGLSDALARRNGTMTRLALGATRASVARRAVTEALLLGAAAGLFGAAATRLTLVALQSTNPSFFAGYGELTLDRRVLGVCFGTAMLGALIACAPVIISESRLSIASLASAASRGIGTRRERWTREALLSGQVAISLVLLFGAALLTKNLRSMMTAQRGFDPQRLLVIKLSIPPQYAKPDERSNYLQRLIDAVESVPGIVGASAEQVSFATGATSLSSLAIEGAVSANAAAGLIANIRHVMPGALDVLRAKVVSGRGFDENDREGGRPVALVSASFAKQYLPGDRILGSRLRRTAIPGAPWMDVVGVVSDVKDAGVAEDLGPMIYVPYRQDNQVTVRMALIARLGSDALPSERAIKTAIWQVDRSQAISRIALVSDLAYESAATPRFQALVVVLFGAAALALVVGGVYALTLFTVLQRTREIGLRSALGAEPSALVRASIWLGLRPVVAGVTIGLLAAVPAVRFMQHLVAQKLGASDIPALAAVLAALTLATLLSALLPARRAAGVSPAIALRA